MPTADDVDPELPPWLIRLAKHRVFRWVVLITFGPLLVRAWHDSLGNVDDELLTAFVLGTVMWVGVGYWVFGVVL